jgi:hypothetical protein
MKRWGETPIGQDPLDGGISLKWAAIQCQDGYISRSAQELGIQCKAMFRIFSLPVVASASWKLARDWTVKITAAYDMTPCNLVDLYHVSEEPAASIFM